MDGTDAFNHLIDTASKVGIVSHSHPDGDALGSSTALWHYMRSRGKDTAILLESSWPEAVDFILDNEIRNHIYVYEQNADGTISQARSCDLLVFTDLNGVSRTGSMQQAFDGMSCPRVLIDHHLNPHAEEFEVMFSTTEISSASELVLQVLCDMPDISRDLSKIPAAGLTAIMTGITTDTNNFANSVFPSTLRAVSDLLEAGVDRDMVIAHVYNEYHERRIRLMGRLISDVMKITEHGVAYMILDEGMASSYGIMPGETEGFVNIPLGIKEVVMSIFVREEGDHFRISIRSKRGVSANKAALLHFNGGGHEQAAGGRMQKTSEICTKDGMEAYILKVTKVFFENEQ